MEWPAHLPLVGGGGVSIQIKEEKNFEILFGRIIIR